MLTLHVEAPDFRTLVTKSLDALGIPNRVRLDVETKTVQEPSPAAEGEDSAAGNAPTGIAPPASESSPAPRRGRPRKNPHAEGVAVAHPASSAAQPAVASNTGSTQPAELPAGDAAASEPAAGAAQAASPAPATTFTPDQVRAKLQEFLTTPGGDAGLQLASKVLGKFGLSKVKQLNEASQDVLAGIVVAVDAEMKALAQ